MKHILPWINWFCRLSFTSQVTKAINEQTFNKLKRVEYSLYSTASSNRLTH